MAVQPTTDALRPPLSREAIAERVARLPRLPLAVLPTPLQACENLSERLGVRLYVKRDDLTGLAFGGNKTRQLEFLLAAAREQGATIVLAGAGTQSNLCRQTCAAAARLGLPVDLTLLSGVKGRLMQGNYLLHHLLGAKVTVLETDDWSALSRVLAARAARLRAAGERPFVLDPRGPLNSLAAVAYVDAFLELEAQWESADLRPDAIYLAGANITPAGLALGARLRGSPVVIRAVSPVRWPEPRAVDIAGIATEAASRLELPVRLDPAEIDVDEEHVGDGYGLAGPAVYDAIRLAARSEGLLLDPVYTGKAFAALLEHIADGRVPPDSTVIFLHTGGQPALFAYSEELSAE